MTVYIRFLNCSQTSRSLTTAVSALLVRGVPVEVEMLGVPVVVGVRVVMEMVGVTVRTM